MAYNIYRSNNYFYILDDVNDIIYEGLAKEVRFRRGSLTSTTFYFDNINGIVYGKEFDFSDIRDNNGDEYTNLDTFVDYLENNTGNFNTASGGSGANTEIAFSSSKGLYLDGTYTVSSPFVVSEGSNVLIPNDKSTVIIEDDGVLYDGTVVTPNTLNAYINVSIRFKLKSSTDQGAIRVSLDIGGTVGVFTEDSRRLLGDAEEEQPVSFSLDAFSSQTFIDNGGVLRIEAVQGEISLYDINYLITEI